MSIALYFKKLGDDERKNIFIKYFATLQEALAMFNAQFRLNVTTLYNEFGQVLPLNYNIQKTGLIVYYME